MWLPAYPVTPTTAIVLIRFSLICNVLQVPAPVAAAAGGFHHTATQRQRAAGGTWNRYPPTHAEG